ncbi:unnamed protein product [Cuscuta epithymum]|uniref:Transposase, Ptta/En/Spm n=1 Tax=Cuscuta epithymum TaxID=186058 RepID=A0AAV0DFT7_9ASTE|nr:unnamed protein product [Cuscuta epithymum]
MEKIKRENLARNLASKRTSAAFGEITPDYEKQRREIIGQNKEKMIALKIADISTSLSSLVDSHNGRKRKEKSSNDPNYVPTIEESNSLNMDEGVNLPKKKKLPKYIAPQSLNRVLRNKQPQGMSKIISKDQNEPVKEVTTLKSKRKSPVIDAVVNMAEYLRKKSGDEVTFQNNNQPPENEVQGHTDISAWTNDEISYSAESDSAQGGKKYQEGNDDDMMDQNIEEFENDGIFMEAVQFTGDEIGDEITGNKIQQRANVVEKEKTTRGPTMMHVVHMREYCIPIILNKFGQPIGPDKATLDEFSSFLGTVARHYDFAPLVESTWLRVPDKDKMWDYVLSKYDVPINGKKWVLSTIGSSWRVHKCRFKNKFCKTYKNDKDRWRNRPKEIPQSDFRVLLKLWNCKDYQNKCSRNKRSRSFQKYNHTAGRESFARIRDRLSQEIALPDSDDDGDGDGDDIPLSVMFEVTRKRTEGRKYKDCNEDTPAKVVEMRNYESQNKDENGAAIDGYSHVMSKEIDDRPIMRGRGVTKKDLVKGKDNRQPCVMTPDNMNTILSDLRKEFEVENEKKNAEIEQMRKEREIEKQKINLVLSKLVTLIPDLDPTLLGL